MGNQSDVTARQAELVLAKILAAAAWADGRIEEDERDAVMRCVRHLGLGEGDAESVRALLDRPIPRSEVEGLTAEFLEVTQAHADIRRQLIENIRAVLGDRSSLNDAEFEFLGYVVEAIERDHESESFLGRIKSLFTWGALRTQESRRSDVAERLRDAIHLPRGANAIADPTRRDVATLYGALLHVVALADGTVSSDEVVHISDFLRRTFAYEDEDVDLIIEAVRIELNADIELFRLTSEFNRVTDQAARLELVEAMFALATADGSVTPDEVESIRRAADHLWIARRDFNDLRVRYANP
jgi:uncharacterized tellurite resistance protein B-like protein